MSDADGSRVARFPSHDFPFFRFINEFYLVLVLKSVNEERKMNDTFFFFACYRKILIVRIWNCEN